MANISDITSGISAGSAALGGAASITSGILGITGLLVASPESVVGYQPQNLDGTLSAAPAILFHYEGEQTATLESDITDHYIEDNTAIQDQIAIKPVMITTQGFIGELNDVSPKALQPVQQLASKLTTISGYAPSLSTTALIAYNEAFFAYQTALSVIDSTISAISSIGSAISGSANGVT